MTPIGAIGLPQSCGTICRRDVYCVPAASVTVPASGFPARPSLFMTRDNRCWRCGQQSHVHTECTVPRKDLPDGRDESNRASLGVFGSSLPLLSSRVSPQTPELCTSQSVPVTLIGRRRPALRWTQSLVRYHHQIPTALTAERRFAEKSSKRPMSEQLSYAVKPTNGVRDSQNLEPTLEGAVDAVDAEEGDQLCGDIPASPRGSTRRCCEEAAKLCAPYSGDGPGLREDQGEAVNTGITRAGEYLSKPFSCRMRGTVCCFFSP